MCIGVCTYSFAVGSLTTILSTLDSNETKLKEKLNIVEELRMQYNLNSETYIKLKKVLKYDHSQNAKNKLEFINSLPQQLKIELSLIMHQETINRIPFFQNRPNHFIFFVGSMLKPMKVMSDEYIFEEGEPINESILTQKLK
jgi:hypothetical protein